MNESLSPVGSGVSAARRVASVLNSESS